MSLNKLKYVLLLGGTGAMGQFLVELFQKRNDIMCFVTSRKQREDGPNIKYLQGNAHDEDFLNMALTLYHWDAIVDFMLYEHTEFMEKIENLLSSTSQYVYVSSARVYADSDDLISEDFPRLLDVCTDKEYLKTNEYALAKARQENVLMCSNYKNWTIIRPSKTYGKNRIQLGSQEKEDWLYDALHGRSIVVPHDILNKYVTFSSGLTVAKCLEVLLCNPKALCNVYNVTGNQYVKWGDVLSLYKSILQKHLKQNIKIKYIDTWQEWLGGSYYQVKYSTALNRRISNRKILEIAPPALLYDDALEGLKNILEDFLQNPCFDNVDSTRLLTKAKYTKEMPSFNEIKGKKKKLKLLLMKLNII